VFEEDTPIELIKRLRPTVLVKGSDYRLDQVVGRDVVEANGGEVMLVGVVPGHSTTRILSRSELASERSKASGAGTAKTGLREPQ
ncbi:MAG: hypothetical protein ACXW3S_16775, partial [Rhodoplanes sp.]